jgi:hypothetical protein
MSNAKKDLEVVDAEAEQALVPADRDLVDAEAQRVVARIQGQMMIAKKFPRNEDQAIAKIMSAAKRKGVALDSEYEYTKGGTKVVGPSIRAMEVISQAWGNLDQGVVELRRDTVRGESLVMVHVTDLEANNTKHIGFTVPHTIHSRASGTRQLTEARDIYERVMNDASRRLRNCLQATIPADIVEDFITECNKTLDDKNAPALAKRLEEMGTEFAKLGVSKAMIEATLGCTAGAITERQYARLRRIYASLRDGFGKVEDYFKVPKTDGKGAELNRKAQGQAQPSPTPEKGEFDEMGSGPL